jgi:hypothetical protein
MTISVLSRLLKLRAASRPAARRTRSFRPGLQALEDRCVPTVDLVTNVSGDPAMVGSLPYEVMHANSGDTIQFAAYLKGGTIGLNAMSLDINKNLTIDGAGLGIIVNGMGERPFQIDGGNTVVINGLTITGGSLGAADGGGIYNLGFLTLTNSTVTGNSALHGGGIYNFHGATLIMSGDSVYNNKAGADGGGVFNAGKLTAINCTFADNFAFAGGGISDTGVLLLGNSTVASNFVTGVGADGGGIYISGLLSQVGLLNTIVYNPNSGAATKNDVLGTIDQAQGDLFGSAVTIAAGGNLGSNLYNTNPLLGPLQNNGGPTATMALLPGSPALGHGVSTSLIPGLGVPTTDQRGLPRAANSIDLGAFQTQPPPQVGPVDVTPLLTIKRGKLRHRGNRYRQTITVQNDGAALQGPLYLVVDKLTRKVKLRRRAGLTRTDAPLGDPYVLVSPAGQVFGTGQTRTVVLSFGNPLRRKIRYDLRVLAGVGTP